MKVLSAEKKLLRALAVLDSAVQEWYRANVPSISSEHYASVHIRDYSDGGHTSSITLCTSEEDSKYVTLLSSKDTICQ